MAVTLRAHLQSEFSEKYIQLKFYGIGLSLYCLVGKNQYLPHINYQLIKYIMYKFTTLIILLTFQLNLSGQFDTLALKSIEGITDKMLELISMEVGEERTWDEYRNLFLPTAQKISIRQTKDGQTRVRSMNIEEFIRNVGPLYPRDGFEEYKIGLTVNEFNGIATAFQSYYCKNLIGTYEARGVNTYQLVYMDDRWWIANTLFAAESDDVKLPNKYIFEEHQSDN